MREWKYLLFLAKYHAKRVWSRFIHKKVGVFYIGGSDVCWNSWAGRMI